MKSVSTTKLLSELKKSKNIDNFLVTHETELTNTTAVNYLRFLISAHNIKTTQLANDALLDRSFTYQLINGTRTPNRNILLRFSLVLHLTLTETQELLRFFQKGELYVRILYDALIIFAIEQKMSLTEANELLMQYNQTALLYEENK